MSINKKNVLLTGGRAPVALDLARKFKQCGHHVYVADTIKHHLCYSSHAVTQNFTLPSPVTDKAAYIRALCTIIKTYNIDLVIPTCEEVFYIASELKILNAITEIFTDTIDVMNQLHNKFLFNQMIQGDIVFAPKTHLITSIDDYQALLDNGTLSYPHVLKPTYSRFAAQTKIVSQPEIMNIDISTKKTWVAQTYVHGELICTYSLCDKGEVLAQVFYTNHFTAGKRGAGISFKAIEHEGLSQWINTLVKQINYTGQIAFDVILAPDGSLWPIECNPRSTSGIHLFAHAQAFTDAFLFRVPMRYHSNMKQHPQLSVALFMYGLSSVRSFADLLTWLRCFYRGQDVIFRWRDLRPFFAQFFLVFQFIKISRKKKMSILSATTHDIEWNGDL